MRLFRPPLIMHWLYPEALFRLKTKEKTLCLTFDDGPDPKSTPDLLEILDIYEIKTVFFCSGKAAGKYPELIEMIKSKGHIIGNHGYNHLNGLKTPAGKYCDDVHFASGLTSDKIFRPPYGRLRLKQYYRLSKTFKIVLWDIMPYDFDAEYGLEKSLGKINKMMRPGSIIVLHDKPVSASLIFLREVLDLALSRNYRFSLPDFHL
ncbi:MAG: peptidoglycan-N-acetylglucosamine deacetylase [Bacteroidota bacterium]|nr:peptidoglycan-N-acetylglucosamine deacetylase [Bacteroidota bacterium]